jgi:hypothetical protein
MVDEARRDGDESCVRSFFCYVLLRDGGPCTLVGRAACLLDGWRWSAGEDRDLLLAEERCTYRAYRTRGWRGAAVEGMGFIPDAGRVGARGYTK